MSPNGTLNSAICCQNFSSFWGDSDSYLVKTLNTSDIFWVTKE